MAPPQPEEAQARPVALLRVGPGRQDRLDELRGPGADARRPGHEPGRAPLPVPLVGLGHVRGKRRVLPPGLTPDVGRHPLPAVEDLDGQGAHPDINPLVDQGMGDGVVVVLDLLQGNAKAYVRFVVAQTVPPDACQLYLRAKPRWRFPRTEASGKVPGKCQEENTASKQKNAAHGKQNRRLSVHTRKE